MAGAKVHFMTKKTKKIKCFVPALALYHSDNQENDSRTRRIRLAVARSFLFNDFFSDEPLLPYPSVHVEGYSFIPDALGYLVQASLNWG